MKRPSWTTMAVAGEPVQKTRKTSEPGPAPPENQGDCWTCRQCGNENWPLRTSCNNKSCGAPGPWTCPACSNKNFQGRTVCNRKGCSQPMPMGGVQNMQGGGTGAMNMMRLMSMQQQMQAFQQLFAASQAAAAGKGASAPPPEGSWVCSSCSNVNWPLRTSCNNKSCNLAREVTDAGPPPKPACVPAKQTGSAPEGSWVCASCSNTNWPLRTTCNNKQCGLPREQADGGPPEGANTFAPVPHTLGNVGKGHSTNGGGGDPEGSWSCPECGNINWPLRTICNKKGCGHMKPT
jgi:hypothetical protein|eukprot:TRINITY_DN74252_c0_g1_i1.p1 TRINITY_DN74252_c0_g1~~TRINITY_DN74252_c0_g1_i1.p1  ORF type:complete len:291 (-),score=33.26 TRINITY_DN74252_c0_g1_i1:108-980(-)